MKNLLSLKKKNSSNQLVSNFFSKTVTFTKFLPTMYCVWEWISVSSTVWRKRNKNRNKFEQKYREISSLVKTLIWRKNVDYSVKILIAFYTTLPCHIIWRKRHIFWLSCLYFSQKELIDYTRFSETIFIMHEFIMSNCWLLYYFKNFT